MPKSKPKPKYKSGKDTPNMNSRFQEFLFMFQIAGVVLDVQLHQFKAMYAIAAVNDPNIKSMIEMATDANHNEVPVVDMVTQYVNWIYHAGPKPYWFQPSDEYTGPIK